MTAEGVLRAVPLALSAEREGRFRSLGSLFRRVTDAKVTGEEEAGLRLMFLPLRGRDAPRELRRLRRLPLHLLDALERHRLQRHDLRFAQHLAQRAFLRVQQPGLGGTSVSFTAGGALIAPETRWRRLGARTGEWVEPREDVNFETKNQPRKAERFGRSTTHSDLPRPFHSPPHAGPTPLGPSLEAMGEASGSPAGSAWAAAALFARVLASSLAVAGPAVLGVPSAFRLDAPMTHEVLTTTRVAAAAHTLVVLVAHALSSARARPRDRRLTRANARVSSSRPREPSRR